MSAELASGTEDERWLRNTVLLLVSLGCAHALLFLLSYALLTSAPGPQAPDAELVAFYLSGSQRRVVLVGLYVMPFAGIAFLWFCMTLRVLIRANAQLDTDLVSGVQLVSGILYVALFFAAAAASSVMAVSIEYTQSPLDPGVARLFPQYGATLLIVFAMRMAAMFVFTTSRLGRKTGVLPRWFAHISFVSALCLLFSASFSRALVLIFPVWLIVLCTLIVWRNARPAAHRALVTGLVACVFAGAARAQDSDEDWKFTLTSSAACATTTSRQTPTSRSGVSRNPDGARADAGWIRSSVSATSTRFHETGGSTRALTSGDSTWARTSLWNAVLAVGYDLAD